MKEIPTNSAIALAINDPFVFMMSFFPPEETSSINAPKVHYYPGYFKKKS